MNTTRQQEILRIIEEKDVETQDQLNVLKELGCDYAQGTLFNKPITIDTFEVRYLKG